MTRSPHYPKSPAATISGPSPAQPSPTTAEDNRTDRRCESHRCEKRGKRQASGSTRLSYTRNRVEARYDGHELPLAGGRRGPRVHGRRHAPRDLSVQRTVKLVEQI